MKDPAKPMQVHLVVEKAGADAPELLSGATGLSRGRIKRLMGNGAVWLERRDQVQRLRRAGRRLRPGDRLHLYFNPRIQQMVPPAAILMADEGDFSVWFKPPGMFSQGSRWGDHCSLARWVETHLEPRRNAFLVHRLDRAASGLMLVAHGRKTAAALARLFRKRGIAKEYLVMVRGVFPEGERVFDEDLDGRPAITRARLLQRGEARSLLAVEIETGRKHQIRRHLAAAGFPVIGDRLHGGDAREDLQLQAVRLAFTAPRDGRRVEYRVPGELRLGFSG